ncbi:IEC3 subunit of the Ino80 complex, chromatin re-modelling-domain-containing protein [Diplogelasinospora grovesii]|uniref:IEC3 subunit of the Ino80 complex, chromatin re-modelling-domain-containing protein n=1 Tax=Diplogelasinospora grovesii TaxID=303347 RepID=A0AAN6N406_9PEZI|nr:IEC3 subunit of the Ino80 complex, chromatin re-modelling-domain-containing protein [Diplogelasinospora grovesii]
MSPDNRPKVGPTYRSWKKKYRKMRIKFEDEMHKGENLHRDEQKALATARRLAIQKDRLLDLLLDVNNSAQIPPDKRFDLSLAPPPSDTDEPALCLDIDLDPPDIGLGCKSYKQLLQDVPHKQFASAAERFPELFADLEAGRDSPADPNQGQPHPPSYLTADDLDNYLYEVDNRLANVEFAKTGAMPQLLPSLAPIAQHENTPNVKDNRDFALRNPTSVYNWLRKHAPKTFLQDAEKDTSADKHKDAGDDEHATPQGRGGHLGRFRAERGGGSSAKGTGRTKRKSAAAVEREMEYDDETIYDPATPSSTVGGGRGEVGGGKGETGGGGKGGKRKRVVDDDPGYRPKGGSSRPTKKKRKSDGDSTSVPPVTKKSRKSAGAEIVAKGGED